MIKFTSGKRKKKKYYSCPTSWGEITFKQWKQLNESKDKKELELVSILTGIPEETIKQISENSLLKLSLAIGFIATPLKISNYKPPKEFSYKQNRKIPFIEDISEKTYGQKIFLQHTLTENEKDESKLIEDSVLIYAQPFIDKSEFDLDRLIELKNSLDNLIFVDLYSIAIAYAKQLNEIVETEARELNVKPTNEQQAAGIAEFSKFGVMNTVKALSNNDVLNYEKVLKIEYNTVFIHLLMNKQAGIYQDNYREILERKHKRK